MVIFLLILCWLTTIAAIAAAAWYIRRTKQEVQDQLAEFLAPVDANTPSPFAQLVVGSLSGAIPELADKVTMKIKTSLMGQASALAKSIDGIQEDIGGDMLASQSPLVSMLLDFSPKLKKRLTKSPEALLALSQLKLGGNPLAGKVTAGAAPSNGHKSQSSMNIGF